MIRPLDTSRLGPIRITPAPRHRARQLYADKVEETGPAYRNLANSIRAGFSNVWIEAAIAAVDAAFRADPEGDE